MTRKTIKCALLTLLIVAFVVVGLISWALYPRISNLKSEYTTASVIRDLDAFVASRPSEWPQSWRDLGDGSDRSENTTFRFDLSYEAVMRKPELIYQAARPIRGVYYTYPHAKSQLDEVLRKMKQNSDITPPNKSVDPSADNVLSLPMKSLIYVSPGSALGHAGC